MVAIQGKNRDKVTRLRIKFVEEAAAKELRGHHRWGQTRRGRRQSDQEADPVDASRPEKALLQWRDPATADNDAVDGESPGLEVIAPNLGAYLPTDGISKQFRELAF